MEFLLRGIIQLSPLWSLSLLAFIPLTAKVLNKNKEMRSGVVCTMYGLALFGSLVLFLFLAFNDKEILSLRFDSYSSGACLLAGTAGLICLVLFYLNAWLDKRQLTEILFFFSQGLVGLYVFCLSQDLMTAFIGLEMASLSIYINLALSRKDLFCLESAIKYFVLSGLAGAVSLYGLSFLFGSTGTLRLDGFFLLEAEPAHLYSRFFFLGFVLLCTGLFFKMAMFPFHFWLADVYQGALTPMTAFMATAVKSSLALFLGKIFILPFFERGAHGGTLLTGLAVASVLTALYGNIMALKQKALKRLVGFSSLAHSGYVMMILVGILSLEGPAKDFSALFYYLLAYIFLTGGLLTGIQCLERKNSQPDMNELKGLFKSHPWFAFALTVFLLGLAGAPPSFGFFAKAGFFQTLIMGGNWWMLFWAFIGSAIGLYYYIKPVSLMCSARRQKEEGPSVKSSSAQANFVRQQEEEGPICPWPAKSLLTILSLAGLWGGFFFGLFFY